MAKLQSLSDPLNNEIVEQTKRKQISVSGAMRQIRQATIKQLKARVSAMSYSNRLQITQQVKKEGFSHSAVVAMALHDIADQCGRSTEHKEVAIGYLIQLGIYQGLGLTSLVQYPVCPSCGKRHPPITKAMIRKLIKALTRTSQGWSTPSQSQGGFLQ